MVSLLQCDSLTPSQAAGANLGALQVLQDRNGHLTLFRQPMHQFGGLGVLLRFPMAEIQPEYADAGVHQLGDPLPRPGSRTQGRHNLGFGHDIASSRGSVCPCACSVGDPDCYRQRRPRGRRKNGPIRLVARLLPESANQAGKATDGSANFWRKLQREFQLFRLDQQQRNGTGAPAFQLPREPFDRHPV